MFSDSQQEMLDKVLAAVARDARVDALLGMGSLVTGGWDEHSDFDFVLIESSPVVDRRAFAEAIGPLLTCFTGEHVGEPKLLICLYGPPLLHVDYKFVPRAEPAQLGERPKLLWARDGAAIEAWLATATIGQAPHGPQWFEDRVWLWLHYGAAKWARGEYFEAISTLDFLRSMVLGPMMQLRAGRPMRGQRRLETLRGAHEKLRPTLAGYDAAEIRQAFVTAAEVYVELRAADPPPRPVAQMPQALLDFLNP
jgi:hypothetical protein